MLTHDQFAEVVVFRHHDSALRLRERQHCRVGDAMSDILAINDGMALLLQALGNAP
ncbi:MAG TPA: hypothetical protein VGR88_01635 [Ktedonobacterales bacterium]|nr:hypothetical protein [Ktedonobacterales bacterium]